MKLLSLLFTVLMAVSARSQIITTVAGGGTSGLGTGGPATAAALQTPHDVAFDRFGNMYISEKMGQRIRKVNSTGIITTFVGTGMFGYSGDGGPATLAKIKFPEGIICDTLGNLYIADHDNFVVRKVNATTGIITTIAGTGVGTFTGTGDGGPATAATFYTPCDVLFDKKGNLYVADNSAHTIRKIDTAGIVTRFAGIGYSPGFTGDGGQATNAQLYFPTFLAIDDTGNIYVADALNKRVRKIDTLGMIRTVAGTGVAAYSGDGIPATTANVGPQAVGFSNSTLFISDTLHRIRYVDAAGIIHTLAGTSLPGFAGDGGPATSALLYAPCAMTTDCAGDLYFADANNNRIRKIALSTGSTSLSVIISSTPGDTVCAGTAVTYLSTITGTPSSYQWYVNSSVVTGATNSVYNYTPVNGDSIKCTTSSASLCSSYVSVTSNTIHMVVNPIIVPTVSVTPSPNDTVCLGTAVTFNPSITGAGTSASYQWFVNGMLAGTAGSFSYIPSNGDSIRCAYTSTSDCGGTVTVNSNMTDMVVNPLIVPTATIAVSPDDTVCSGVPVTISAVIGGGSAVSYTWYKNGVVVSASGATYTYVPANGDSVRCVVSTTEGCTGSAVSVSSNTVNMVVPVTVVPSISILSVMSAAIGDAVTVSASVSGASAYVIKWMNKGVVFNTTTVPLVTYVKGMGTDTITAKVIPTGVPCYDSVVSNMRQVSVKLGVASVPSSTVYVYPNPVGDELVVEHVAGCEMKVCDVVGRCVLRATIRNDVEVVDVSRLESGVYVVVFSNDDGVKVVRVVKR